MDLHEDDVIQIMKLLDKSNFNELRLEMGDLKLIVNKAGSNDSPKALGPNIGNHTETKVLEHAVLTQVDSTASPGSLGPVEVEKVVEEVRPLDSLEEEGLIAIKAPMLGVFYRAPKPDNPPFVEVGTVVKEENTVCIVEVMKLFSTISAGLRGRIAKICAENGQLVEYNQVMFLVEPEAA
jgi:acetyl-CoA carboxylase biotin carboxyl carrier protein